MATLPLESRIPESEYLAALDLISRYKAQIEEETSPLLKESFGLPKKGDRIELLEVPYRKATLEKGEVYTVARVIESFYEVGVFRIFLLNGRNTYKPEITTKNSKFRILPA